MILLLACLATDTPALAQAPKSPEYEKTLPKGHDAPVFSGLAMGIGDAETDRVQLLDVDLKSGKAALKVVFHESEWEEAGMGSIDCKYPGMSEHPTSGVTLGLFDLKTHAVTSFEVYPMAREPGECGGKERNEKVLADAKAAFSAAGLDIAKKPAPVMPDAKGVFHLQGGEVQAWKHSITADDGEQWKVLISPEEPDFSMGATLVGLRQGERVLVSTTDVYSRNMAGGSGTEFPVAWQQGDKVVFLAHGWYRDMRSGSSNRYGFSSVITLAP